MMMPGKFRDDISNGSRVLCCQTDRQTTLQTDTTENNTTVSARLVKIDMASGIKHVFQTSLGIIIIKPMPA